MKDFSVCLALRNEVHGDNSLDLVPMELFGFGLGDFKIDTHATFTSKKDLCLPFTLENDCSKIVWSKDSGDANNEKALLMVCEAFANVLSEKGIDGTTIQFYKVTQKARSDGNTADTEIRLRYTVDQLSKTTAFFPADLADEVLSKQAQKHAVIGACLNGNLSKLPRTHAGILWDCRLQEGTPPIFRPVKPNMWLMCKTTLHPGKFYRLT